MASEILITELIGQIPGRGKGLTQETGDVGSSPRFSTSLVYDLMESASRFINEAATVPRPRAHGLWEVNNFFDSFFILYTRVFGSINAETKNGHVPTGKCLINDFIKLRRSSSVGKDTCYQPWGADFNLWLRTAGARTLRLSLLSLTSTDIQAVVTSTCSCTLPEESETVIIKSNLLFDYINFTLTNNKISTLYLPVLLYYNCFYLCTILN